MKMSTFNQDFSRFTLSVYTVHLDLQITKYILSGSPDHTKAKREKKGWPETVLSCCSAAHVFNVTCNNNSADPTAAIGGPCFIFWCLGKGLDNHCFCSGSVECSVEIITDIMTISPGHEPHFIDVFMNYFL